MESPTTSSSKSNTLPPKFRLRLQIPLSLYATNESPATNRGFTGPLISNGLPSPTSMLSFKRPISSSFKKQKRLRLTYKAAPVSEPDNPMSFPGKFQKTNMSVGDINTSKSKKSCKIQQDGNDTKQRALRMIQWALSCNIQLKTEYEPLLILGWGGCGVVFEAQRRVNKKNVAIKIMYKSSKRSGLPSEIDILRSIKPHPAIISYLEHFEDSKAYYLVMAKFGVVWTSSSAALSRDDADQMKLKRNSTGEFILDAVFSHSCSKLLSGTSSSLFEYIDHNKSGRVPQRALRPLFKQISEAIQYLHNNNIVHGDIKEENILIGMVKGRLVAKLCDFGHAIKPDSRNPRMRQYGTRVLTPPELLGHLQADEDVYAENVAFHLGFKQDIWALGIVFYTMIHGSLPPENESYIEGKFNLEAFEHYPTSFRAVKDPKALNLLKQMLCIAPLNRISANEIMEHPYFSS